jgi:hypothetical protein
MVDFLFQCPVNTGGLPVVNSNSPLQTMRGVVVLYSKSGIVPRSSLLGAGQLGFGEFGKGGTIG